MSATDQQYEDFAPSRRGTSSSRWVLVAIACLTIFAIVSLAMSGVALQSAQSGVRAPLGNGTSAAQVTTFRLLPGADLIGGIMQVVNGKGLKSAWIVSCVGSLTQYAIRFANNDYISTGAGHFEIVSLVGTMTSVTNRSVGETNGGWHIHISLGDGTGKTISGHLAVNSTVYTTAEIVVGFSCDVEFSRGVDGSTPWDELQIHQRRWC